MNSEFAQNLSTSKRCQYIKQEYYSAIKNRYTPKCIMQKRKNNVGLSFLLGHSSVVCTDFWKRMEWKWFYSKANAPGSVAASPEAPGTRWGARDGGQEGIQTYGWTDIWAPRSMELLPVLGHIPAPPSATCAPGAGQPGRAWASRGVSSPQPLLLLHVVQPRTAAGALAPAAGSCKEAGSRARQSCGCLHNLLPAAAGLAGPCSVRGGMHSWPLAKSGCSRYPEQAGEEAFP